MAYDEDTGRRRRLRTEAEDLEDRVWHLERRDAEMHGFGGTMGRFGSLEAKVNKQETVIESLTLFRARMLWLGAAALAVGGVIAALAFKLIDWIAK